MVIEPDFAPPPMVTSPAEDVIKPAVQNTEPTNVPVGTQATPTRPATPEPSAPKAIERARTPSPTFGSPIVMTPPKTPLLSVRAPFRHTGVILNRHSVPKQPMRSPHSPDRLRPSQVWAPLPIPKPYHHARVRMIPYPKNQSVR
ncbi:hypothetical protein BDZ94DRAFT_1253525 [Collybia nuda]|uniref:Uncharacterized protein n=1 Tax=Collybia nuda TaxID=64659 RepID=A0A9P6CKR5_9AGAR|nr:hypothetical protein BDZ94DRAFT_1253525 [Collybia nuda]